MTLTGGTARSASDLFRVMRKVKLVLSREELQALGRIAVTYLAGADMTTMCEQTIYLQIYKLYDGKLRRLALAGKPKVSLVIDIIQAWAMWELIQAIDLDNWPYEDAAARKIIGEIDKQTA